MNVYLGVPRGFCAGVVMAIDVVEIALRRLGPPVYMKHQIVHNPYVVGSLEKKGAITVEKVEEIPNGSTVVFSAHGSPPEDYQNAKRKGLHVVDATCPLVTKVHNEAKKYDRDGRKLILVGHKGHQEVKGTMGQRSMFLVDDRAELDLPEWPPETPVAVLTQTTLSVDDTQQAIGDITATFGDAIVRNDLCYATTNRQETVKELCKIAELILVIGAPNSSNCNRLRDVAEAQDTPAYLINHPDEIDPSWLANVSNIGITSGASTPDELVSAVIENIAPDDIVIIEGAEEDVKFKLPVVDCCEDHISAWHSSSQ